MAIWIYHKEHGARLFEDDEEAHQLLENKENGWVDTPEKLKPDRTLFCPICNFETKKSRLPFHMRRHEKEMPKEEVLKLLEEALKL